MKKTASSVLKKNASAAGPRRLAGPVAGDQTRQEIFSQPETWMETAQRFEQDGTLARTLQNFTKEGPWLFVACGSSYYLSLTIAAQWAQLFQTRCAAVPASELLFAPQEVMRRTGARQVVLVSRSGKTTEVLRAAEWLKANAAVQTLGVTCNEDSALEKTCTHLVTLPWADEKSMVMTRSFTSILLLFERLGATLAGTSGLTAALNGLPEKAERWLAANADKIRALGTNRRFAD